MSVKYDAAWQCTIPATTVEVWNDASERIIVKNVDTGALLNLGLADLVRVDVLLRLLRGENRR